MEHPLHIQFVAPSRLFQEVHRPSDLPIVGNGPPGTFVIFPDGLRVSLPTDQLVSADDTDGSVRVAFGGMRFVGIEDGQLAFARVRELWSDDALSPDRSHKMLLDPTWVVSIVVSGEPIWLTSGAVGA